jgi:hypothetical protein
MTFDLDRMIRKCIQLSENETNSQKKEMLNKVIEILLRERINELQTEMERLLQEYTELLTELIDEMAL